MYKELVNISELIIFAKEKGSGIVLIDSKDIIGSWYLIQGETVIAEFEDMISAFNSALTLESVKIIIKKSEIGLLPFKVKYRKVK